MVISELDEIYYLHIRSNLKEELEEREFEIPIENFKNINVRGGLNWVDIICLRLLDVLYVIYNLVYFHFSPYFIFLLI